MTLTYIFGIKRAKGKTLKVQKLHTKFKYWSLQLKRTKKGKAKIWVRKDEHFNNIVLQERVSYSITQSIKPTQSVQTGWMKKSICKMITTQHTNQRVWVWIMLWVWIMSFEVPLEVIQAYVSLCTQLASVGSNPCMFHGVFFQFTGTGKTFPTFRACIRAFAGVNALMKCHLACHGESFPTHRALVGPFIRVRASVYLQLAGWDESLAAVGAQIRLFSSVNSYVYVQISGHRESLPTICTLKWPLACVTTHVKVQVLFVFEGFATKCTNLCLLLRVAQLVSGQIRHRAEKFAALLAPIGQLWRMNLLMKLQLTHAGVHLPALLAREHTALLVSQLMLTQQALPFEAFPALRTVKHLDTTYTLVFKFVPHRLKAFPTFDANIICFPALCPPVAW